MRERTPKLAVVVLLITLALPAPLWAQDEPAGGEPVAPATAPAADPAAPPPPPAPPPAEEAPDPTEVTPDPPAPDPEPADPATEAPAAPVAPATPVVARQGGATVSMIDYAYQPASVQIDAGQSITFTSDGPDEPHTATASDGSFDTGEVAVGGSATVTFDQAGSFPYVCTLHPNMKGTVTVLAADTGGPTPNAGDGGGTGATTDVPGPTEEAAVASPDAAGSSSALPATGAETGLLAAAGLALLACGLQLLAAQRLARRC